MLLNFNAIPAQVVTWLNLHQIQMIYWLKYMLFENLLHIAVLIITNLYVRIAKIIKFLVVPLQ